MRQLTSFVLLLALVGCGKGEGPADEQLPAVVIAANDRCTLIETDRSRLDVACRVEPLPAPLVVRVDVSPCGAYSFVRGAYTPLFCERGCDPVSSAQPGCPLRHQASKRVWSLIDLR